MGRIPTVISEIDARSGRSNQGVPSPTASPDAFGAPVGRALQQLGGGLQDFGAGLKAKADKKREEDVANRVAQSDFTSRELALRNSAPADGTGYQETVLTEYDAFVKEEADKIEDPKARADFTTRMMAQRPSVSSRSAQWEFGTAAKNSENELNTSLAGLDNRIRLQPDQLDDLLTRGIDVINSNSNIPEVEKAAAVTNWTNKATRTFFEGRLEAAEDVYDVDAVIADLNSGDYADKLSSEGMDALLGSASSAKKAIATQADADARAAVDFLEGRSDDPTMLLPEEEIAAAQEVVAKSGNPITQARMARVARDQEILRETRKLPPGEQRDRIEATKDGGGGTQALPQRVVTAISNATAAYGVSGQYLAAMTGREYGGQLKADGSGEIDYGVKNVAGASSATGVAQIVDGTMLALGKNPSNQAIVLSVTGIDMSAMSDAELLELRANPDVSILLAAAYAAENAAIIKGITGRNPTDGELYMAHFLGGGGVSTLLRGVNSNPDQSAADLLPAAAKANPGEFYKKDGEPRTVGELYNRLGSRFSGGTTYVAYGDVQTRESILKQTEDGIKNDPMNFGASVGVTTLSDIFDPAGMTQRGVEARRVADYYSIPMSDMKPFTTNEAEELSKRISEGTADEVLQIVAAVQAMGGDVAKAGMKQLGETNDVYAYAGGLQMQTGEAGTASDIVRGQKRITENPEIVKNTGASEADISNAFLAATGNGLFDISPAQRQSLMNAAAAHYVETVVARGGAGKFDPDKFAASVDAVMGGKAGAPVIQEVNGEKTPLPPGVTGEAIEEAFGVMQIEDWTAMSDQRLPPRYANGTIADPRDIEDEATLKPIGGGKYKVALDDGTYLVTGQPGPNGRFEAFILVPTAERLEQVATRTEERAKAKDEQTRAMYSEPGTGGAEGAAMRAAAGNPATASQQLTDIMAAQEDGNLTAAELQALIGKYGENWAYDAEGNRVAPVQ